jgi:hypothetical protein
MSDRGCVDSGGYNEALVRDFIEEDHGERDLCRRRTTSVDVVRPSYFWPRWESRPCHRPIVDPRRELAVLHTVFADVSGCPLAGQVSSGGWQGRLRGTPRPALSCFLRRSICLMCISASRFWLHRGCLRRSKPPRYQQLRCTPN